MVFGLGLITVPGLLTKVFLLDAIPAQTGVICRLYGSACIAFGCLTWLLNRSHTLGKVDKELLLRLLAHDFFRRKPPRSAWRLDFGSGFADKHIVENRNLSSEDLFATFTGALAAGLSGILVRTGKYRDGDERRIDPAPTATVVDLAAAVDAMLERG